MSNFQSRIKPLLSEPFEVVEVYDDGTNGSNEVARLRLRGGIEIVQKVMLAITKYHQRRKALTEATMYLLDKGFSGNRVVPDLFVSMFEPNEVYSYHWGKKNIEGHNRVCQVVRDYAPGTPGDEWRGEMYRQIGNLEEADIHCKSVIDIHPDAERISILDFLTISQDRSARNWVTNHGTRFYGIDNGMAWFHRYHVDKDWREGCVIDDVIIQVNPWQFISGVFTTSWAGRELSPMMQKALAGFDEVAFLEGVEQAAQALKFPKGMSQDWRFEGILRRMRWMVKNNRQPSANEFRDWLENGSELMTPPEIMATGGKRVWVIEWDKDK